MLFKMMIILKNNCTMYIVHARIDVFVSYKKLRLMKSIQVHECSVIYKREEVYKHQLFISFQFSANLAKDFD